MITVHIFLITLAVTTWAHMSLWYPPPLGGSLEANPLTTRVDNEFNFPIGCCDSHGEPTLPSLGDCRGHLDLLDTEEGRPQVTWEPGQDAHFQLSDYTYKIGAPGSNHYGGSCQVGFSVDKGRTWKVAASYHGNCPHRQKDALQIFQFRVPLNIPSGPAVFAWVWLNREHESFMNCASVQIGNNPMPIHSNSTPSSTMYHVSLASPTDKVSRRGQHRSGDYNKDLTGHSSQSDPKLTRSQGEHAKHRHGRKHFTYYYHMRKTHRHLLSEEHRHSPNKRASDACDWDTAPRMETSYYSVDANCAPKAKLNNQNSDTFEIGWSDACGVIEGDKEYTIQDIKCGT